MDTWNHIIAKYFGTAVKFVPLPDSEIQIMRIDFTMCKTVQN